jgi:hypothetical protein
MLCLRLPPPYEQLRRGSRRLFYKKYDLSSLKTQYLAERCDIQPGMVYKTHSHSCDRPLVANRIWLANDCYNDGVEIFLSNPALLEKLFVAIILKYLMKKRN